MIRIATAVFFLLVFLTAPATIFARTDSFVSVVNPIRGEDFWAIENQRPETALIGQVDVLKKFNVSATFLLRFDAFENEQIVELLKSSEDEKGLFLEITPTWTDAANVAYHQADNWHQAGSAFLSGYQLDERVRLIDTAFEKFKSIFGFYPKSIGAWWIDSFSLGYMQEKYKVTSALIVANQYTTDNYQIWGQYFSTPYYPSKKHALHPAQSMENKLPVVMMQWAARDPLNGYGDQVEESTYSVQANDYIDYHNLDTSYFSKLLSLYTKQDLNSFGHLVVGLENSYLWEKYKGEYAGQIKTLIDKQSSGQLKVITMEDFASWYLQKFPALSPAHIIVADDPLGTDNRVVWFMNPYFRAGWFFNADGSVFRDIRQYVEGEEELCFQKRCDVLNFATSATRVLDEVSFGHKMILDQGKIFDFKVEKIGQNYLLGYKNEAGRERQIEFMPRDISIDGKVSSIDTLILEATKDQLEKRSETKLERGFFDWSIFSVLTKTVLFLGFLILGCLVPGLILIDHILPKETSQLKKYTLSTILGFSLITLVFYILAIVNLKQLIFVYLAVNFLILIKIILPGLAKVGQWDLPVLATILAGTIFQNIPTFKNGLNFPYGLGFWGPNTHDGLWHVSLINQLTKSIPPQNPILAGELLKNYHYFYDLLVASTAYITQIPIMDLVFRFYPITFSVLLGAGTYCLIKYFFNIKQKLAILLSLYLVYFAGSFGWIVEYIKFKHLGGESAFWANQSISFNLNPPFAVSLLLVIAILLLLPHLKSKLSVVVVSILVGPLIAFKAYGGILILASFVLTGILKRNLHYIMVFLISASFSMLLFLSNFTASQKLIIFSPFWFIHSMIDSPDRVGWVRLSLARTAGAETGNWFKFISAETISFLIFLIGNLGTRVFALLSLIKLTYIVRHENFLFVFIFSSLANIFPLFFIQAGNPWNTIQFIYYFLYLAAVLGGMVLVRFPLPLMLIFIVMTPINSWATAQGYLSYNPHAYISNQQVEALKFLKNQQDGVVLTYPYDGRLKNKIAEPWPILVYDSTAYISAISGKQVFVEDEPQNQILLTDYKKRLLQSLDFFTKPHMEGIKILADNQIKYIYLAKIFDVSLNPDQLNIKMIFENNEVKIYEVQ